MAHMSSSFIDICYGYFSYKKTSLSICLAIQNSFVRLCRMHVCFSVGSGHWLTFYFTYRECQTMCFQFTRSSRGSPFCFIHPLLHSLMWTHLSNLLLSLHPQFKDLFQGCVVLGNFSLVSPI